MRIGINPNNHKNIDLSMKGHRVIIPVYIPNFEGYFKDSLNVFKICIESLTKTINSDIAVTVISNGSCLEVNNYITDLYEANKIDKAVFNKENIGKMNAIMSETRACFEDFITYSDADVFFDKGWLKETFEIFKTIPKAGFVSLNPTPGHFSYSNSTLLSNINFFFKKSKITKEVCNFEDLLHFNTSIGKDLDFTEKKYNSKIYSIEKGNKRVILGAGHFCCTIRRNPTLKYVPLEYSKKGVSGGSEAKYLDEPFDKTGLLRLSSTKAFVWHMGNILENSWAREKIKSLETFKEQDFSFNLIPEKSTTLINRLVPYFIIKRTVGVLKKIKFI